MYSGEIERCLRHYSITRRIFRGVFSRDKLPKYRALPGIYVVNTKPSSHPGEHWVVFYVHKEHTVDYFDSFGNHPLYSHFLSFLQLVGGDIQCNKSRLQSLCSQVCGIDCILYAYACASGKDMKDFCHQFSPNRFQENDTRAVQLFHHLYPPDVLQLSLYPMSGIMHKLCENI